MALRMHTTYTALPLPERVWRAACRWAIAWWHILYLGAVVLVLVLSPSSYSRRTRWRMARHMYQDTAPILLGFTVLAALLCLVITRIVMVTAQSYGLTRYALEMLIRVLVLELIPLTAALFVAMRATIPAGAHIAHMRETGASPAPARRRSDTGRIAATHRRWCLRQHYPCCPVLRRCIGHGLCGCLWPQHCWSAWLHAHVRPSFYPANHLGVWPENPIFQHGRRPHSHRLGTLWQRAQPTGRIGRTGAHVCSAAVD